MKKTFIIPLFAGMLAALLPISSCKKELGENSASRATKELTNRGHLKQVKTYSSEVLQQWINFDLRLLRTNATLLNNFVMMQHWAYSSIALYESLLPGMPDNRSLSGQLSQMPEMPEAAPGQAYHWPTVANTVMAQMKRYYYPSLPAADKTSTDSLESALNAHYQASIDEPGVFDISVNFGKAIAQAVYQWSLTDGSLTAHPPYVLPVGPGQWERTPTGFLNPQNPYWSTNRPLVPGLLGATEIAPPPAYSTSPGSTFLAAAQEVYSLSQTLTNEQKDQVIAWRDVPGGGHAHWLAIYNQVLAEQGNNSMLDKAVEVYVKLGITQSDARISTWKAKYQYNLLRPVTYLRAMGYTTWNSFIATPNHPEYPSAHSSFSTPAAIVLSEAFGNNYSFVDHTYDFLGLVPRYYSSFNDAAEEAGNSRVLGGLHYRFSISAGAALGTAVVDHMKANIMFNK